MTDAIEYLTSEDRAWLERNGWSPPVPPPPPGTPQPFQHVLYKDVRWQDEYGAEGWSRTIANRDEAEVVSSEVMDYVNGNPNIGLVSKLHAPVLDIDMPAYLIPSSTPGHSHLYIDHRMTWRSYKRLLRALAKAGILEKGYVKASIRRKHTAVRVPWRKKDS